MKKILLLAVLFGQVAFAQRLQIKSVEKISTDGLSGVYHPKFSPKGDYILLSGVDYSGLKMYSFANKGIKTITNDPGAGYGTQISDDGNTILYKKNELKKNLKYSSLVSYSKISDSKNEIVPSTRESLTAKLQGNTPVYVKGKKMVKPRSASQTQKKAIIICVEDRLLALYIDGSRKVLAPNGSQASYIWPSISPDQKRIVYTVASKGTFVCDLQGKNVVALGKLNAPVWLNNRWIVGMDDKDDGEKLISSVLVAVTTDGKTKQTVVAPQGKMAMYPAASSDGKRIAFNTENGELYVVDLIVE